MFISLDKKIEKQYFLFLCTPYQGVAVCIGEVADYSSDSDTSTHQVAQLSAFSLPYLSRII